MIDITPDPIFLRIFGFPVYWYGIGYALGLLVAYQVLIRLARWAGEDPDVVIRRLEAGPLSSKEDRNRLLIARTKGSVPFPEAAGAVNTYPIAVLKESKSQELARKFVDLVTGDAGQKVLNAAGFAKP